MKNILTTLTLTLLSSSLFAQHQETIKKEIVFEQPGSNNVFYLANINGEIEAEAYDGDRVQLEARMQIKAKTDARLQKAVEQLSLGYIDRLDTIIVYIKGLCASFQKGNYRYQKDRSNWCYDWDDCKENFDFKFDFTLKVPQNMNVYLSTVNQGDITVTNVKGSLNIHNVNGGIALKGIESTVYAHTINGDVSLDYNKLPDGDRSYFYTLNGDIEANYPQGLKADVSFKSYNGDLYTNIDDIEHKNALVEKTSSAREEGVAFKVNARSLISVRGGGTTLDFETFNGDVYVKEN